MGNSIRGPITSAIAINSWPGKELIAIARANGELRASVVIVRLAYSAYVKLIFSDINRSIVALTMKNTINGMNIVIIEFKFENSNCPCDANMQKTASAKNQISAELNNFVNLFKLSLSRNFVICAAMNGRTITISIE